MSIKKYKALSPDPFINKIPGDTEFARLAHLNNLVDQINLSSGGGYTPPYRVYTAILSQSGTNAPVATVLENTIGIQPIFTYNSPGDYKMEFPGLFPIAEGNDKTAVFYKNNSINQSIPITQIQQNFPSTNEFTIYSRASVTYASFTAGQQYNTIMNGTIEIRVYN